MREKVWILIEKFPFLEDGCEAPKVCIYKTKKETIVKAKELLKENAKDRKNEYTVSSLEKDLKELDETNCVIQFEDDDDMMILFIKPKIIGELK